MVERFIKLKPEKFSGISDPRDADNWREDLKKIFNVLNCIEVHKHKLAVCSLFGDASKWWESVSAGEDHNTITWTEFCISFDAQYFLESIRSAKVIEFMTLEQGSMTMTEYDIKFRQLLQFASDMYLSNERRARKFKDGLVRPLRKAVKGRQFRTYNDVVECARTMELDRPNDASKTYSKKENKDKYDNYSKGFKAQNQQGQNSQPWKKQRIRWQIMDRHDKETNLFLMKSGVVIDVEIKGTLLLIVRILGENFKTRTRDKTRANRGAMVVDMISSRHHFRLGAT
ncbi:hypothetical protein IFM89_031957 [Coptis chinensis]|uniref:Retrotransposon gag domain-containing protein n=1 Tax=Coptis chinensis TaxID=261450 RepID=A0A835ME24_9MAGN|nr:hypothetical protein IFM89_031957 [Coptis chinensis]